MPSPVIYLFCRWLQQLEKQGKTGQYELAALIPDPPGSAIFTVGDLRELVKILNAYEGVNMSANDRQVAGNHYSKPIQHWDFVLANGIPYMEAQIIRYVVRWREKDGITDLEKCRHYLDKLIEHEKEKVKKTSNERSHNPAYCPHGNINIPPEFICKKCQPSEEVVSKDDEFTTILDLDDSLKCPHGEIHRPPAWICSYCLKEEMDAATKVSEELNLTGKCRYITDGVPYPCGIDGCYYCTKILQRIDDTYPLKREAPVLSDPDFGIPPRFGGETVSGYTNFPPPDRAKRRENNEKSDEPVPPIVEKVMKEIAQDMLNRKELKEVVVQDGHGFGHVESIPESCLDEHGMTNKEDIGGS